MKRSELSWVEVSSSALRFNVRQFKRHIGGKALYLVIKSNAYGHGIREVVSILNHEKAVAGFMVAGLDEALIVQRLTKKPVVILSMWQHDTARVSTAVRRGVVFPVYDLSQAEWLNALGGRLRKKISIHIKVDVGTLRLGFRYDGVDSIARIVQLKNLRVQGIFGHFADSENKDESFTQLQADRFDSVIRRLESKGMTFSLKHIACSAAALRSIRYHYDAVRVGIGLYGLWPSSEIYKILGARIVLKPVLSWKTRIIQIKTAQAGETVGYGLTFRVAHTSRMAALPIGYWDGYDRKFSNQAEVLTRGTRSRVRGRVCMNITMIEIPRRIRAAVGDEVVLIGSQGKHRITAEELARIADTISYEIVSRINPLVPRRVAV